MTWARQVGHVAMKDARMLRWFALAYLALVLLWPLQPGGAVAGSMMALLVLAGLGGLAQAVQADSPIRSDAFWISRPLSPGAVFGAKLLSWVALVVLATVGNAMALWRHAAPGSDYPQVLAHAAFLLAAVLATGLALGAVTRDLRTFGLAWIVALSTSFVIGALLGSEWLRLPFGSAAWFTPLLVLGSLAVAACQYRTGRRAYSVGLVILVGLAAALINPLFADDENGPTAALTPRLRAQSFEVALLPPTAEDGARPPVGVRVGGTAPEHKYVLRDASMDVLTRNGQRRSVRMGGATLAPLNDDLPSVPGATWSTGAGEASAGGWVKLEYRGETPPIFKPVTVRGRIEAWRGRQVGSLPLLAGQSLTRAGRTIQVLEVTNGQQGLEVKLRLQAAGLAADHPLSLKFAILDRGRNTVFPLTRENVSGGNFSFPMPVAEFTMQERQPAPADDVAPPRLGAGPLELLVFEWQQVGSYDIAAPVNPEGTSERATSR